MIKMKNKEYLFILEDRVMVNNLKVNYINKRFTYLLGPLLSRYYEVIRIQIHSEVMMYDKIKSILNKIKVLNIIINAHGIEIEKDLFICGEDDLGFSTNELFNVKKLFLFLSHCNIQVRVLCLTCYSYISLQYIKYLPKNSYIVSVGALNYNYEFRNQYFVKSLFFSRESCDLIQLAYYDQVSKISELRDPDYKKEVIKASIKDNKGIIFIKEITYNNYSYYSKCLNKEIIELTSNE
jgi:hypothetical protein